MPDRQRCTVSADPASAPSIQQAIDSLDEGGLVYLRPGRYRIERTIRLRSGVTVAGAGADATVLEARARVELPRVHERQLEQRQRIDRADRLLDRGKHASAEPAARRGGAGICVR